MPNFLDDAPVDMAPPVAPAVVVLMADGTEVPIPTPGSVKPEHGDQVRLTGEARAAARGALHGDILSNTIARDAAVSRGDALDGQTIESGEHAPGDQLPVPKPDTADAVTQTKD